MLRTALRELSRRRAVARLDILDTAAEPTFDRFVEQAAAAFEAPVALLSIVEGERLWFKAARGIEIVRAVRTDTFCNHAIEHPDILEVCDAGADARFCALPVVAGPLALHYYIGVQLRLTGGAAIGALCVLDTAARAPASPDQRAYLSALARQAALALEVRADAMGMLAA